MFENTTTMKALKRAYYKCEKSKKSVKTFLAMYMIVLGLNDVLRNEIVK